MTKNTSRIYGLDILRAFAILFVLFGHGNTLIKAYVPPKVLNLPILDGVSIFFVLSGFLIGGILLKIINRKEKLGISDLFHFWIRRWFRTIPNYMLFLVLLIVLNKKNILSIGHYFLFLQNLSVPHPTFFAEAWSLAVEEWFYLLIPIMLFFLPALFKLRKEKAILIIIIATIVSITVFRIIKSYYLEVDSYKTWDMHFRKVVITRIDSIMFGVLGAYLSIYHQKLWNTRRKTSFWIGISLILIHKLTFELQVPVGLYLNVFSFSLMSLGTLMLLPYLSNLKEGKGLAHRFFTHVSLISYSMYLINYSLLIRIVIPWLSSLFNDPSSSSIGWMMYLAYHLLAFTGSYLIYKYYEIPFMNLRDFFTPERLKSARKLSLVFGSKRK